MRRQAVLKAMRLLDRIEKWHRRATVATQGLSGRTPSKLVDALRAWPHLSAPMAQEITGASRVAVQSKLTWLQDRELVVEVTGQGRFRMWRVDC